MSAPRKVALIAFGIILGLSLGFVGLRLLDNEAAPTNTACQPAPGDWEAHARALLHDYRVPCDTFYWLPDPGGEFHTQVRLNNYGLHAPDYTLAKAPGVFRIVIVGDSFPQGMQVEVEQTFPQVLQAWLNRDTAQTFEVINLSMDAYGTDRELLLYALIGWQFDPDLVLLSVYTGNDVQDNHIDLEQRRYGYRLERPFFTPGDAGLQLHNSPIFTPDTYDSPVFRWLAGMQAAQAPPPPENPPPHPAVISENPYEVAYPVQIGLYLPEDAYWREAWALTEALLMQFRDVVETAGGVPFGVLLIPDRRAVYPAIWGREVSRYAEMLPDLRQADPMQPTTRLETFLGEQGIPVLNLAWALRAQAGSVDEPLYYPGDGHFTPGGHQVVAQRIALWLPAAGLVP